MEDVKLKDLKDLSAKIVDLRLKAAEAKRIKAGIDAELDASEEKMLTTLTANDMTQFRSEHGLMSVGYFTSVKTPKSEADKQSFYEFLKSKGLYDSMISVNSSTLNSFYKSEMEAAIARGEEDCKIPGLNDISISPRLSVRK